VGAEMRRGKNNQRKKQKKEQANRMRRDCNLSFLLSRHREGFVAAFAAHPHEQAQAFNIHTSMLQIKSQNKQS
jgi:hypothetical protein